MRNRNARAGEQVHGVAFTTSLFCVINLVEFEFAAQEMNFVSLNTAVLVLGFASSYIVFALTGTWEFGGIAGLNPLKPVAIELHAQLNVHVIITLTWVRLYSSLSRVIYVLYLVI
jgi:hypothetical protein